MRGKYSSPLHKILPIILCVLLFVCIVPPVTFADDSVFEAGGGETRGGGVGRIHDGLKADISAAPRSGDLICNSCGAEYSSENTLPIDFKCPTCGEDFFSVSKVILTCWKCKHTTFFYIDDITSTSVCSYCGAYISSIVKQGDKIGYAFKAGGGKTRGGGTGRHHGNTTTIVLDAPTVDSEKTYIEYPSDASDINTWNKGHGMLKMEHAFSYAGSRSYSSSDGTYAIGFFKPYVCEHVLSNDELFSSYINSLGASEYQILDDLSSLNLSTAEKCILPRFVCDDDFVGISSVYPSSSKCFCTVFYCAAPESGYYWVSHYPYGQAIVYGGTVRYSSSSATWQRNSNLLCYSLFAQPDVFVGSDGTSKVAYNCSDGVGISNCLYGFEGDPNHDSETGPYYSPVYYNKGDYIFFLAWVPGSAEACYHVSWQLSDPFAPVEVIGQLDCPYVSYVPANLGIDGETISYDWQFDDDDDTYILITYPDPIERTSYSETITYEEPETPSSGDSSGSEENGHCDHTGIIEAIHQFNKDFNSWTTSFGDNIETYWNRVTSYLQLLTGKLGSIFDFQTNFFPSMYNGLSSQLGYYLGNIEQQIVTVQSLVIEYTSKLQDTVYKGFTDITTNINSVVADFKAAVVQGFADVSANFQLAIDNLNLNITNIFNKKFPDQSTPETADPTPTPSPDPSEPTPSPAPTTPPALILPDTQKYIIPTMTANTYTDSHGTWIASGSSFAENRFAYYNAFNPDGFWVNGLGSPSGAHGREMPCWLQIEIPDPENYYIDGYMIHCGPDDNFDTWQILGSNDGETWETLDSKNESLADDDDHKYTVTLHKAYKYYRLYIEHFSDYMGVKQFNLMGYDASDVTPTPSPDIPDTTPTPAPTDKPDSGNTTNNFWNIIFPSFSDDGTDSGHKGIFWALVSLILAIIAFFTNMLAGYKYLFPFLPDGVVMTINACVFVLFLFVVIKFIMRSK